MVQITEDKFGKYLEFQIVGSTNMNLHKIVSEQTGLTIDEIKEIQNNYKKYIEQFPDLKEEIEAHYFEDLKS